MANPELDSIVKEAVEKHPLSMLQAAGYAKLPFGTFKYHAKRLGVYAPNQSGKGTKQPNRGNSSRIPLMDILSGMTPYKGTGSAIKKRLIDANIKQDICEECGQLPEWNGRFLVLQLDHINGNHYDWKLENLRILCPNCHTQTDTFCVKAVKCSTYSNIKEYTVEQIILESQNTSNITDLARKLNLNPTNSSIRRKLEQIIKSNMAV